MSVDSLTLDTRLYVKKILGHQIHSITFLAGVISYTIDFPAQKVTVTGAVHPNDVFKRVSKSGKLTSFWPEEPKKEEEPKQELKDEKTQDKKEKPEENPQEKKEEKAAAEEEKKETPEEKKEEKKAEKEEAPKAEEKKEEAPKAEENKEEAKEV